MCVYVYITIFMLPHKIQKTENVQNRSESESEMNCFVDCHLLPAQPMLAKLRAYWPVVPEFVEQQQQKPGRSPFELKATPIGLKVPKRDGTSNKLHA